jgi:hypothetical protein
MVQEFPSPNSPPPPNLLVPPLSAVSKTEKNNWLNIILLLINEDIQHGINLKQMHRNELH